MPSDTHISQAKVLDRESQAALKGHTPLVVWFTGLSGAGKSTIAEIVARKLHAARRHVQMLDGDRVRLGLSRDLGFSDADRLENIRRVAEAAAFGRDAGLIVLVALISPRRGDRAMAQSLIGAGDFVEVFVDTPLGVAEARDPKGLYKRARAGHISQFTGIDSAYERPETPMLRIETTQLSAEEAGETVTQLVLGRTAL